MSSALAAAGKPFEPVTPRFVAFIASTACSPSSRFSVFRRSDFVSFDVVVA